MMCKLKRRERHLQADEILRNLNNGKLKKSIRKLPKKAKKKAIRRRSSISSVDSNDALLFIDKQGAQKKVEFIWEQNVAPAVIQELFISDIFMASMMKIMPDKMALGETNTTQNTKNSSVQSLIEDSPASSGKTHNRLSCESLLS